MVIKLTDDEMLICQLVGRMRSLIARGNNVKDAKMGEHNGSSADVMGFIAEYAFAKWNNVFPDLGLSPRSGSCDGILNNIKYDVKATNYPHGRLLSTLKVNPDVDLYILGVVIGNSVEFVGYATKDELIRDENIINLGHGNGYGLSQDELNKF